MENVYSSEFDDSEERVGFHWDRIRLGRRLGGELLGASIYVLPKGQKSFPYHAHHANEELLLVLEGEVELRTPGGTEAMGRGDAILFQRGPEGAHQVTGVSDDPARFIMFSTMVEPEVAEYPDSGNIGVFAGRAPGGEGETRLWRFLDGSAERDYFHGED